jgi:hypothetical protein
VPVLESLTPLADRGAYGIYYYGLFHLDHLSLLS